MGWEESRMERGDHRGVPPKRGFKEDRRGSRFQDEEEREARRHEDLNRERQLRERMTRGREMYRMGDPRGFRDGDQFGKRRAMEPTDLDRGNYQNN